MNLLARLYHQLACNTGGEILGQWTQTVKWLIRENENFYRKRAQRSIQQTVAPI